MPRHAGHQDAGPGTAPVTGPAKKDLKAGSAQIETILRNPPQYVETAKVFDILMAVPKFGRVKAARFLNQCRISQSKTVGGLSDRQRAELVALLRR
jgi:S13-like H2TH domain